MCVDILGSELRSVVDEFNEPVVVNAPATQASSVLQGEDNGSHRIDDATDQGRLTLRNIRQTESDGNPLEDHSDRGESTYSH